MAPDAAAAPTARQLAAAVCFDEYQYAMSVLVCAAEQILLWLSGVALLRILRMRSPTCEHPSFDAKDAVRKAAQDAWVADVEHYAGMLRIHATHMHAARYARCMHHTLPTSHVTHLLCADQAGFDTSPPQYRWGGWSVESEMDFDAEYLECHRQALFLRLRGHEQQPSSEENPSLPWPHCDWWQDRDRILLMTEYLDFAPPDGTFEWERCVCHHAMSLWSNLGHPSTDLSRPG